MTTKHHYRYGVIIYGDKSQLAKPQFDVESTWTSEDPAYIAEDAAEDFHSEHDGWECKWPLTFDIFDGPTHLGRFQIEREYNPEFSAEPVDAPTQEV